MNPLLEHFLNLRCAGDVLNAVSPINNPSKEITESMALWKWLRPHALEQPDYWSVLDLCAGNALTSILAVHSLPIREAFAIDKTPRERPGHKFVRRFHYLEWNIHNGFAPPDTRHWLVIASHPCGTLAERVLTIGRDMNAPTAALTCCRSSGKLPILARNIISLFPGQRDRYAAWSLALANQFDAKIRFVRSVLSPCNILISREAA